MQPASADQVLEVVEELVAEVLRQCYQCSQQRPETTSQWVYKQGTAMTPESPVAYLLCAECVSGKVFSVNVIRARIVGDTMEFSYDEVQWWSVSLKNVKILLPREQ